MKVIFLNIKVYANLWINISNIKTQTENVQSHISPLEGITETKYLTMILLTLLKTLSKSLYNQAAV